MKKNHELSANAGCKLREMVIAALSCAWTAGAAAPDLVPMPKEYQPTGAEFLISGVAIFTAPNDRQCAIGAEDVAARARELGGAPGAIAAAGDTARPGIYILTAAGAPAQALIGELSLAVTPDNPGTQGYVIHPAGDRLVVIGSDSIGALYGAMTLRQMLRRGGASPDGAAAAHAGPGSPARVVADAARVYDKPDYKYRAGMSVWRGLGYWAEGAADPLAAYKAGIDWLMRFKINLLTDYPVSIRTDAREVDDKQRAFLRAVNDYAAERGLYPILWRWTSIDQCPADTDRPEFNGWDCVAVKMPTGDFYFCWSRDDLAREMIERNVQLFRDCGFKILALHPVDGGGIHDPETWSRRCRACRQRFGDERWRASVHQFNLWSEILRESAPDAVFSVCIYPYAAEYADRRQFAGVPEDVWLKNSVDYWRHVHEGIAPDILPQTWIARPENMAVYRRIFQDRPVFIYAHSFVPAGYFGAWHRNNGTDYTGHAGDMFYLAAGFDVYARWMNVICSGEYAWNTRAPGHGAFQGCYYDMEQDHAQPRVIFDEWVPRACRAFFGPELGARLAPVYQAGVLNSYIMNPPLALALANKQRRRPLAAVDPMDPDAAPKRAMPDIVDSAALMASQIKATATAWQALQDARQFADSLDQYRRRTFMYFYKRMPLWHMIARARYAMYRAGELTAAGDRDAAVKAIQEGLAWFAADRAAADKILAATAGEPDLSRGGNPLGRRGDVKPAPDELEKMLRDRLAGLTLVLQPRKPAGRVRIGIHAGYGDEITRDFFGQFTNAAAEIIESLSLAVLDQYDCVLIMQSRSLDRDDFFNTLPRYVREGGRGVLFQHDLCGMPRAPFGQVTPFPEIVVKAAEKVDAFNLRAVAAHPALPGLKAGDVREHMYYDHLALEIGPAARVLLEDEAGRPVVAAAEVGLGKVIFDGNVNMPDGMNVQRKGRLDDYINGALMRGAVEWFTGVELR